jgi:hypothetical protein
MVGGLVAAVVFVVFVGVIVMMMMMMMIMMMMRETLRDRERGRGSESESGLGYRRWERERGGRKGGGDWGNKERRCQDHRDSTLQPQPVMMVNGDDDG